jgi:cobaltochelatase CobS
MKPTYDEMELAVAVQYASEMSKPRVRVAKTFMKDLFTDWDIKFVPLKNGDEFHTPIIFAEPTMTTPVIDPFYVWPEEITLQVMSILEKKERKNIWIDGPSGSGKTAFGKNLAALMRHGFYRFDCNEHMTPANAFGRWKVLRGETVWVDGIITKWMRHGGLLLVNEYSTLDSSVANALKSCFDSPRVLVLTDKDDEVVEGHPDCDLIVTDNTKGRGDDSGQFVNANVHSVADLRRFNAFFTMDYLSKEAEIRMLKRHFPAMTVKTLEKFVKVAGQTRRLHASGGLDRVLSTADVVNWVENCVLLVGAHVSAKVSFLNGWSSVMRSKVQEVINTEFGNEDSEILEDEATTNRAADTAGDAE